MNIATIYSSNHEDACANMRDKMVKSMQVSLPQIRQLLNVSAQELSQYIGITRQTINNLENNKNKGGMSESIYLAISAFLDYRMKENPALYTHLASILASNEEKDNHAVFWSIENHSLINKWFLHFPGEEPAEVRGEVIRTEDDAMLASTYRIFVAPSILMEDSWKNRSISLIDTMRKNGNKFMFPYATIKELQCLAKSDSEQIRMSALSAISAVFDLQRKDCMELRGHADTKFTDAELIKTIGELRMFRRITLITNDKGVASELQQLNKANDGFKVLLLKCREDGTLCIWHDQVSDDFLPSGEDVPYDPAKRESVMDSTTHNTWSTI